MEQMRKTNHNQKLLFKRNSKINIILIFLLFLWNMLWHPNRRSNPRTAKKDYEELDELK